MNRWKSKADEVCRAVLRELPPETSAEEARAALSVAYPFGTRECTPYRIWLETVSQHLRMRFPEVREAKRQADRAKLQAEIEKRNARKVLSVNR